MAFGLVLEVILFVFGNKRLDYCRWKFIGLFCRETLALFFAKVYNIY
jgi:hypothetical protein